MGKAIDVNDTNFESEVIKSDLPVLVDFWATWCGACKNAAPIIDKIAVEYEGKIKVCKLNVDDGSQTSSQYSVMSIPTLNFFKGGKVVDQIVGVTPDFESDIKGKISKLISSK
ncbi:MAG: thioredoxin [Candidatus Ratteibacteria bacterium]|nr:thioredoxin [Candidatus Ratteibacteria bacterium]